MQHWVRVTACGSPVSSTTCSCTSTLCRLSLAILYWEWLKNCLYALLTLLMEFMWYWLSQTSVLLSLFCNQSESTLDANILFWTQLPRIGMVTRILANASGEFLVPPFHYIVFMGNFMWLENSAQSTLVRTTWPAKFWKSKQISDIVRRAGKKFPGTYHTIIAHAVDMVLQKHTVLYQNKWCCGGHNRSSRPVTLGDFLGLAILWSQNRDRRIKGESDWEIQHREIWIKLLIYCLAWTANISRRGQIPNKTPVLLQIIPSWVYRIWV